VTVALLLATLVVRARPMSRLRRPAQTGETDFFEAVASELRRGASLRHALAWAMPGSASARLAGSGQPMAAVVAALEVEVPLEGELAGAGIVLASRSGAAAAPLFIRLAGRSRARRELARELRVLTAQARLSAAVVGLIPVGLGLVLVLSRGGAVLASPAARSLVAFGLGLQLVGLATIALLLRGHR
jgi:Flp pilus assembly protein TadB